MKRRLPVIAGTAMLAAGSALAQQQCEHPAAVTIPDGASASLEEMLEAQSGVRDFLSSMEAFLECVNGVIESASEETPPETRNSWIESYNSGVGEMETVAARFNEERIAYQQANPPE